MVRFNQAIGLFMEYAFYNPDTLVLITADHETGGLYFDENGTPVCPYDDHTSANVPFFAYGQGAEVFDGFDGENNLIPQYIAAMWGIESFGDGTLAAGN
jgi:alkaline phosphatase